MKPLVRASSRFLRKALGRGAKWAERLENRVGDATLGPAPIQAVYADGLSPFNLAPLLPLPPLPGRPGKVSLLIPGLGTGGFFGGIATALIVAGKLSLRLGKGLRIVESSASSDTSGLSAFFEEAGIPIRGEDVERLSIAFRRPDDPGGLDIHPDDDFVASAWWDAHVLGRLPLPRPFVYLMQDYEPIFFPNGDRSLLAENTYRSESFVPLCNTKLMYDFLAERYPFIAREGRWFEPAASFRQYGLCRKPEGRRTLFLYGRPKTERNLFYTALEALDAAFGPGGLDPKAWRIVMAGQDKLPDVALTAGIRVENLGKLSLPAYRSLALEVDLAVSLMMAPHPNYPTLEMASVGAAVVTTRYANKQDLSSYSKNIHMAELTPKSIVAAILEAAAAPYETRIANAETSNIPGDWEATLALPIEVVATILSRKKLLHLES